MATPRRLALIATVAASLVASLVPSLAIAASVPRISASVTDSAGVLEGRIAEVETALAAVLRDDDVQVFVLFVDSTGDLTATEFADETARVNSFGANDALVLVAVDDRTDAIWASNSLDISDETLNAIIADTLEPALGSGDFAAAAIETARALGRARTISGKPGPVETDQPGSGGGGIVPGDRPPAIDAAPLIGVSLLGIGAVLIVVWLMSRVSAFREAEERDRATGRLAREANALLLATDERTRTADQEAGFVEAEFGEDEAAPFRTAIAAARDELRAAFAVRQRLDDAEPETRDQREAMLKEIVERCQRAGVALDREAAHIAELRQLERDAPAILAALPARIDEVEARLPATEASLQGLRGYADSTWNAVKGNLAEARKGLTGARAAVVAGNDALARSDGHGAARQVATAQDGVTGAAGLLDALDKLALAAKEAETKLPDELEAAEQDLAAARSAAAPADVAPSAAAKLTSAEESVRSARAAATAVPLDPLAAYQVATEARHRVGEVLATLRQDEAQRRQFAATLVSTIASAKATADRAADFIAARRGGVGRRARTRLAEAERSIEQAEILLDSDPRAAMDHARRAQQLAASAYSLAAGDFGRWDRGGPSPVGGGSDVAGAILGGIIGGMIFGNGRGGGWGGSPWGSSGPTGGGGGWGGGDGGGGHSAGGSFGRGGFGGGGGGHSQGGHW